MLEKMSEELYVQLEKEIGRINAEVKEPFAKLKAILKQIREALGKLRAFIITNPFKDDDQQIYFFKHIKPKFYCLRIFYLEWYELVTSIPAGDKATARAFYFDELKASKRFFKRIAFHYQYYRLGATELDSLYFIRGVEVQSVLIPEVPELDPEFSTSQDYLFSKIRAFEMLQDFIIKELGRLNDPDQAEQPQVNLPRLQWTGEQVNLVELIYGLYYTGQLNHGNVEVKDIITLVEIVFQVEIKAAYHVFGNIRRRKSISPTAFMDKMREAILKRVDDDLAFHPNRDKLRQQHV